MARKNIGIPLDRANRNNHNDNYKELYGVVNNLVDTITDEVYEQIIDGAKLNWKSPVDSENDLPTSANEGDAVMTRDDGKVYRYDGSQWREIQQIDAGPVNEVDSRLSSQLADIAINIKDFGAVGDGVTDNTQAIKDAYNYLKSSTLHSALLIPKGIYKYDNRIVLEGISDVKTIFYGTLKDNGKDILLNNGTHGEAPVGLLFKNCPNLIFESPKFTNDFTKSGQVADESIEERYPQVDFKNCDNLTVVSPFLTGRLGSYVTKLPVVSELMRFSYMRFHECNNLKLLNPTVDGVDTGIGEMYNIYRSDVLEVKDIYHNQRGQITFWSIGNIIDCNKVHLNGIKVKSNSAGSLLDISGQDIVVSNIQADYPNGGMLDITSEWGEGNVDTHNITVKDCNTNGSGFITHNSAKSTKIKNLTIENVSIEIPTDNANLKSYEGVRSFHILDAYLKSVRFSNVGKVIYNRSANDVFDYRRDMTLDECEIETDVALSKDDNQVKIETSGNLVIKNTVIDLQNKNDLNLFDASKYYEGTTDLRDSKSTITFKNCIIKNCTILISANVDFVETDFENVAFRSFVTNPTAGILNPRISFIGGSIKSDKDSIAVINNTRMFRFGQISYFKMSGTELSGEILNVGGYGLFHDFYNMPDNHGELNVDLIDTDFNVEMVTSSGAKDKRSLFNVSNGTFKNIVRINLKGNKFYDKINAMTFNHSLASAGSDRFILTLNDNDFGGILNIDYLNSSQHLDGFVVYNLNNRYVAGGNSTLETIGSKLRKYKESNNIEL